MGWRFVVLWWMLAACGGVGRTAVDAAPAESAATSAESSPGSPEGLYAACRERLEQPEASGECGSDEDCAATGCGGEVCTTAVAARDLVTSCEVRPCFRVVEACACRAGQCQWSLKSSAPKLGPPIPGR